MRNKRKHVLTFILFCSLVSQSGHSNNTPICFYSRPDSDTERATQIGKEVKANYARVEQAAKEALKENNPYRKLEYLALAYQMTGEKDMRIRSKNQSDRQAKKKPLKQRIC